MDTNAPPSSVEIECTHCGFSLTLTETATETAAGVPDGLPDRYQARILLEDHGWSSADDRALCSSCNS